MPLEMAIDQEWSEDPASVMTEAKWNESQHLQPLLDHLLGYKKMLKGKTHL
jgi:hypothetical protein